MPSVNEIPKNIDLVQDKTNGKTDTTRAALTATAESINMKEWEGLNDLKLSKGTSDGVFVYWEWTK